jgi:NlpC/P60 family putative phage cell wall peptidase
VSGREEEIVAAAREWLGTPYRHQGSVLGVGCDCLGLVRGVWRAIYGVEPVAMPAYRADMRDPAHAGSLLAAAERWLVRGEGPTRPGQVVLFKLNRAMAPKHCGIMVGTDRFIHAQEQVGVVEAHMSESWARRVAGAFGFPG